ncbi:Shugoshin [Colletotrichum sidae]|uniref:Shugoshin n=1 Tax=Colletotrichum sidae TaxID=1347389 RepID=A0A4R8TDE3_9PEZI|nr:Shugoshin [Colletotrichum sidae]
MARLNEPPVSADSIDTLRRKLLRQNRDLAKSNAAHLLRNRNLEADYARLMSDNLRLEGRIIELEKELDDNRGRRIADHALDVRARLEAQLLECMSTLAGLGQEPPTKRHASPRGRRSSRASLALGSPPQRRPPRELVKDTEARALQEGRLPPIFETKSYPRATLDREQILALCSEAADTSNTTDTTESPELGPPPMSRFVDEGPVDIASPSKAVGNQDSKPIVENSPVASPSPVPQPSPVSMTKLTMKTERSILVRPDPGPEVDNEDPVKKHSKETPTLPAVLPNISARTGSKRKYSVGEDTSKAAQSPEEPSKTKDTADRPIITRDRQKNKTLKELTSMRREARERVSVPARQPLSAKSTNDDVTSPTKTAKAAAGEGKPVLEKSKPRTARERVAQKVKEAEVEEDIQTAPVEVPIPSPSPPPSAVDVIPSTETVSVEAALLSPASPEPTSRMSLPGVRDTPPPADISSQGETSRPSRRARAAVSYAEPNLRDKMRRPTKELFDAVSGQTRYLQRSGSAKSDSGTPDPAAMVKRESADGETLRAIPSAMSPSKSPKQTERLGEYSLQRSSTEPNSGVPKMDRKKRSSSMMSRSISETDDEKCAPVAQTSTSGRVDERAAPSPVKEVDPYEFTSPAQDIDAACVEMLANPAPTRRSKSSRRLSSAVREDFKLDDSEGSERIKAGGTRKRASMVLPKRNRGDADGSEDSSFESLDGGDAPDTNSRVSMRRRRSMML